MKQRLADIAAWEAAAFALLVVLYFLMSPLVMLEVSKPGRPMPSWAERALPPLIRITESEFRRPVVWYLGLWNLAPDCGELEPIPPPPWYVTPTYLVVGGVIIGSLVWPFWRLRRKRRMHIC
jgi:hypothetical protein